MGGWEGDETRCEEGETEKKKTHPADRGGGGCRSPLCVCAGQPSRGTEEGRMWPDKMERERSVRKKRKLERGVEEEIFSAASSGFVEWIVRTST